MKTSPLPAITTMAAGVAAAGLMPAAVHLAAPLAAPLAAQTPEVVVGPNLRVGPGQFNEPWIAASPENPDFLIAVTQTGGQSFPDPTVALTLSTRSNAAFLSRDGGVSWESVALPGDEPGAFDPMVVPGPDGRMWILYCYVGANTMGGLLPDQPVRDDGTIMVWSTDDEGATWVGPARLRSPVPPDHARIAADWSDGPRPRPPVCGVERRARLVHPGRFPALPAHPRRRGRDGERAEAACHHPGRQARRHRAGRALRRDAARHLLPVLLPADRREERRDAVLHHAIRGRRRDLHRAGGGVPDRQSLVALRADRDDQRVHAADRGVGPNGGTPRGQHLRRVGPGERGRRGERRHLRHLAAPFDRWRAELVGGAAPQRQRPARARAPPWTTA